MKTAKQMKKRNTKPNKKSVNYHHARIVLMQLDNWFSTTVRTRLWSVQSKLTELTTKRCSNAGTAKERQITSMEQLSKNVKQTMLTVRIERRQHLKGLLTSAVWPTENLT